MHSHSSISSPFVMNRPEFACVYLSRGQLCFRLEEFCKSAQEVSEVTEGSRWLSALKTLLAPVAAPVDAPVGAVGSVDAAELGSLAVVSLVSAVAAGPPSVPLAGSATSGSGPASVTGTRAPHVSTSVGGQQHHEHAKL